VQQAHLRRFSVFCLEAAIFAKFRLKMSYATASHPKFDDENRKSCDAGETVGE
jgi:hypothetical protein